MATWEDVSRYALSLPGVSEDRSSNGTLGWGVNKKGLAWERPLRKGDIEALGAMAPSGPILAIRTPDLEMKEILLASDPAVFFTTPHFHGYPAVLVQLKKIKAKQLKDALLESWLAIAPKRAVKEFLAETKQ